MLFSYHWFLRLWLWLFSLFPVRSLFLWMRLDVWVCDYVSLSFSFRIISIFCLDARNFSITLTFIAMSNHTNDANTSLSLSYWGPSYEWLTEPTPSHNIKYSSNFPCRNSLFRTQNSPFDWILTEIPAKNAI